MTNTSTWYASSPPLTCGDDLKFIHLCCFHLLVRGALHIRSLSNLRPFITDTLAALSKFHRLNLIDAGGSEDHRKTWHQHFDDAVVLFYVVSLTDYSHVDAATHRNVLSESFVVYRSLVNSLWFEEGKVKVMVVLAKPDLFETKIAR